MEITSELMKKVRKAETPEEIQKIAKENNADISLESAKMIFATLQAGK